MFPMRHLEVIGSDRVLCGERLDEVYYVDRDMFRVCVNQYPKCLEFHKALERQNGGRVVPKVED